MSQSVKLKIAGKEYKLEAATPEMEQLMRRAAADVEELMSSLSRQYQQTDLQDMLAIAAWREAAGKLLAKDQLLSAEKEKVELEDSLESYLREK